MRCLSLRYETAEVGLVWLRDRNRFPDESVNLIYLDPPFNSNADYNVIFNEMTGEKSKAQLQAFDDTWEWEREASALALNELASSLPDGAQFIEWLASRGDKTSKSMSAYLGMMAIRLLELRRVLHHNGSIYLHCDSTASHYLKILMDTIFSPRSFRNEIIWKRVFAHSDPKKYGRVHDTLLFYTKGQQWTWNKIYGDYDPEYIRKYYRYNDAETGEKFLSRSLTAPGGRGPRYEWKGIVRNWRVTRENMEKLEQDKMIYYTRTGIPRFKQFRKDMKGPPLQTIWTDILPVVTWTAEGLGFETQKPVALLRRIIEASSNVGEVVLDPFCGCGSTLIAASDPEIDRRWIGIDITHLAINLIEQRLKDNYGQEIKSTYIVEGNPFDVTSAQALWDKNTKEFELWALSLVEGARPRQQDRGVDGILGFVDEGRKVETIVVQVKGGEKLSPYIMRDLIGTVENEKAAMGLLITLHPLTSGMMEYAVHQKPYTSTLWERAYPRIQVRTIKELLVDHKEFELPPRISLLKKAAPAKEQGQSPKLL